MNNQTPKTIKVITNLSFVKPCGFDLLSKVIGISTIGLLLSGIILNTTLIYLDILNNNFMSSFLLYSVHNQPLIVIFFNFYSLFYIKQVIGHQKTTYHYSLSFYENFLFVIFLIKTIHLKLNTVFTKNPISTY